MKIAFILNSLEIGGIGSVASLLANRLALISKIKIDLVLLQKTDKFFDVINCVRVIENPNNSHLQSKIKYTLSTVKFIRTTISKGNYDRIVVHGEWITSFIYFSLLGKLNCPIYFYDHSNPLRGGQHMFPLLMKYTYSRADGIFVLSEKAKKVVFSKSGNKYIYVVDNIVDLPDSAIEFKQTKKQGLYLGRLAPEKAPDVLLRAIAKLRDQTYSFVFVGDGKIKGELLELAINLGVDHRVQFVGKQKPERFLYEASIYTLPSHTENFPLALIEAMSIGLPAIITDCISWRGDDQFIEHMKNGMIVPKNNPEALAEAIDYLIEHEDLRDQFGREALKIRERFDHNRIVKDFLKAIDIHE